LRSVIRRLNSESLRMAYGDPVGEDCVFVSFDNLILQERHIDCLEIRRAAVHFLMAPRLSPRLRDTSLRTLVKGFSPRSAQRIREERKEIPTTACWQYSAGLRIITTKDTKSHEGNQSPK
jgi:hypothetical protein